MKKTLSIFLAAILPMMASAYDAKIDGIYYDFHGTTAEVTYMQIYYYNDNKNAYEGIVVIPETVTYNGEDYSVTSIGELAFLGCSGLTSVTIPNSMTSIGETAFEGCSGLASIKVESGNKVYDSRNDCNAIINTETRKVGNFVTDDGHFQDVIDSKFPTFRVIGLDEFAERMTDDSVTE